MKKVLSYVGIPGTEGEINRIPIDNREPSPGFGFDDDELPVPDESGLEAGTGRQAVPMESNNTLSHSHDPGSNLQAISPRNDSTELPNAEPSSQQANTSKGTIIPETQSSTSSKNAACEQNSSQELHIPRSSNRHPLADSQEQNADLSVRPPADDDISAFSSTLDRSGGNMKSKELKPIPIVSPSKFLPHIRPSMGPLTEKAAALVKATASTLQSLRRGNQTAFSELPSSIESQFTPKKVAASNGERRSASANDAVIHSEGDIADDEIESDLPSSLNVKARILPFLDRGRRRLRLQTTKRSLNDVLAEHSAARPQHDQSTLTSAPATDEEALVREMEDAYMDLDGGAPESAGVQKDDSQQVKELESQSQQFDVNSTDVVAASSMRDQSNDVDVHRPLVVADGHVPDPFLNGKIDETRVINSHYSLDFSHL